MGDRDVAATAVQLWKALQDRYGLKSAYDSGLVEEIRATLGLPDGPMPTALRRQGVTNEQLLHAVLLSLQPLAAMLADLLRLFERANATMADKQNLRVSYDFGSRRPPLDVDLDQFREWTRRTTHAVGPCRGHPVGGGQHVGSRGATGRDRRDRRSDSSTRRSGVACNV